MYDITFLRHGESTGNAEGYHQGQSEFPLTEKGQGQAQALAARWVEEGIAFDYAVASPQARARETAEIVTGALGLGLEFDPLWMERDNGVLAGLHHTEAEEVHPRPDFSTPYDPTGKTGEGQWALFLRGGRALQTILRRPPGRYLVVSHGGLLNQALNAILGVMPQANFQGARYGFNNTGFTRITYRPELHQWRVMTLNDQDHLVEQRHYETPYHFTLLRHAESEGNAQRLFQGQMDFPLSETGRGQAQALAARWQKEEAVFDQIIASPQSRAYQTAEIIAEPLGLSISTDEGLKEVDCGNMSGITIDQLRGMDGQRPDRVNIFTPLGETGETWWNFYLRAGEFLHRLLERPPGRYLIVAHGGTLNALLHAMLGINPRAGRQTPAFQFDNAGFATVTYDPGNHNWRLVRVGGGRVIR